jgi:hypothetical protein
MSKKVDPDVSALKASVKALNRCTSPAMIRATLEFLWDRYIVHPPANRKAKGGND